MKFTFTPILKLNLSPFSENRLSELATMGIGNKPCLDIKPSRDNIQDRNIILAVGNKEGKVVFWNCRIVGQNVLTGLLILGVCMRINSFLLRVCCYKGISE